MHIPRLPSPSGRTASAIRRLAVLLVMLSLGALTMPAAALAAPQELLTAPRTEAVVGGLIPGQLQKRLVTAGLSSPVYVTNAGDGSGRLFVVEQAGRIRVVKNGALQPGYFLDIHTKVASGGERGLLGLAFDPDFSSNRKLFVYYTRASDGDIVIAEYTAAAGLGSVSASTEDVLLTIDHSTYANHNGGMLTFGPDGYLYAGTGDGGSAGDPLHSGQSTTSLLGKILRIDPDLAGGYSIPAGNPFGNAIWAYGLRNPWRFSFDATADTLWIADVGQGAWEEVNRQPDSSAGLNYGWNCREGFASYAGCGGSFTDPILAYSHSYGCSITGGFVYRGSLWDSFVGNYVYGDYCSGRMWSVTSGGSSPMYHGLTGVNISSFGEGEDGEIYMTDLNGRLFWIVAPPFLDIGSSSFLFDIVWLEESGITSGCGGNNFCPTLSVSRGQMAAFLARALKLPATPTDYFTDDNSSIFEGDINKIAAAGITGGCTATKFCPDDPVRRDQMASFLARALKLAPTGTNYFTDDAGNIHEGSINRLAAAGITGGCTATKYCPASLVTREQMAAFLHRAFG
jgi:glucose/arabinose dehydrogenase